MELQRWSLPRECVYEAHAIARRVVGSCDRVTDIVLDAMKEDSLVLHKESLTGECTDSALAPKATARHLWPSTEMQSQMEDLAGNPPLCGTKVTDIRNKPPVFEDCEVDRDLRGSRDRAEHRAGAHHCNRWAEPGYRASHESADSTPPSAC